MLGGRLREAREELGLSQRDLARAVGVARQQIGAYEGDLYEPSLETIRRICRVLGIGLEELVVVADETEKP